MCEAQSLQVKKTNEPRSDPRISEKEFYALKNRGPGRALGLHLALYRPKGVFLPIRDYEDDCVPRAPAKTSHGERKEEDVARKNERDLYSVTQLTRA